MLSTPKANRLHISILGKRNAGKSSLINALTNQSISVVSNTPGTTTDPVSKSMELLPLGPIVIVDTAGFDDEGELGNLRIEKTKEVINKTDLAILVFSAGDLNIDKEKKLFNDLTKKNIPIIGVINKIDIHASNIDFFKKKFNISFLEISSTERTNISKLKEAIINNAPMNFEHTSILGDIVKPKNKIILVAPQDLQAPKGRLILPQVQIIRDILDHDALALTVKYSELKNILSSLNTDPDLIITDSQIFKEVSDSIPSHLKLTSFSILMARYKGDLPLYITGAKAINTLKADDKVLISEACTHHPLEGDIAREKLPMLLKKKCGGNLDIEVVTGSDFPKDLSKYKLILQCGSCMFTRRQVLSRLETIKSFNVPVTNFGVALAELNNILSRACNFLK